jgi:hypothetical protein
MGGFESSRLSFLLLTHDFHNHPLVTLTVKFSVENSLPSAEVELTGGDGNDDFVVDEQGFQVGIAVVLAGFVMLVVLIEGGELFQPAIDVFDQAWFVIVDVDSGGDVHGGNQDHAFLHAALLYRGLDLWRDVDVGAMGCAGFGA